MWILETNDGDRWSYDENELENARRDKYIFGGEITHRGRRIRNRTLSQ